MEIIAQMKPRRIHGIRIVKEEARTNSFRNRLSFYDTPPTGDIFLSDLEKLASDRLKLLKAVELVNTQDVVRGSREYYERVRESIARVDRDKSLVRLVASESESASDEDVRRNDAVSHFILRLAFCKHDDVRRWFIQTETDLFRFRFVELQRISDAQYSEKLNAFFVENGLHFETVSESERQELREALSNCTAFANSNLNMGGEIFRVHFTKVPELVRSRKTLVRGGFAFVPQTELVTLLGNEFRMRLSKALAKTAARISQVEEDTRLLPLLTKLSRQYLGYAEANATNRSDGTIELGSLSFEQLETAANRSFPLCMQQLYDIVKREHHLKHMGRMQLGLFLKAVGLSLNDSLRYWRTEFCKKMETDRFDKQYAYNIRHNYGLEGKRANYSAFSCVKVLNLSRPGVGEVHGCPYRHLEEERLRNLLQSRRLAPAQIDELLAYSRGGHYQVACRVYLEQTHGVPKNTLEYSAITTPHGYFGSSIKLLAGANANSQSASQPPCEASAASQSQVAVKTEAKSAVQ